jgi:hypothetical protein
MVPLPRAGKGGDAKEGRKVGSSLVASVAVVLLAALAQGIKHAAGFPVHVRPGLCVRANE